MRASITSSGADLFADRERSTAQPRDGFQPFGSDTMLGVVLGDEGIADCEIVLLDGRPNI